MGLNCRHGHLNEVAGHIVLARHSAEVTLTPVAAINTSVCGAIKRNGRFMTDSHGQPSSVHNVGCAEAKRRQEKEAAAGASA
jgi:hypothetical protein